MSSQIFVQNQQIGKLVARRDVNLCGFFVFIFLMIKMIRLGTPQGGDIVS